jgi:hypothetical protein
MVAEVASKSTQVLPTPANDKSLPNGASNGNADKKRSDQKQRRRTKKKSRKQREEAKANVSTAAKPMAFTEQWWLIFINLL